MRLRVPLVLGAPVKRLLALNGHGSGGTRQGARLREMFTVGFHLMLDSDRGGVYFQQDGGRGRSDPFERIRPRFINAESQSSALFLRGPECKDFVGLLARYLRRCWC